MLEKNYKTLQSLDLSQGSLESKDTEIDFSSLGDSNEDETMEMDDDGADDKMDVEDGDAAGGERFCPC